MATKRLSRTIVEGGKRGSDKHARKMQLQKSRRAARDFCKSYKEDDVEPIPDAGKYYWREFNDRLRPLVNFLDAHVGYSWDDIYSKLCAIRSRDTIQGWHFIEHAKGLLFSATGSGKGYWGYYLEDGILKEIPERKSARPYDRKMLQRYQDWVGERKVRLVGTKYFWYELTYSIRFVVGYGYLKGNNYWRQGDLLSSKEIGHMEWIRAKDRRIWNKVIGVDK